eukprot:scaffold7553_cov155-Amphora_coffeaeformis.AAC.1
MTSSSSWRRQQHHHHHHHGSSSLSTTTRPLRICGTVLVTAVLSFYAGLTIGSATAHSACTEQIQILHHQQQQQQQQRKIQQQQQPPASDTDRRFPDTVSDIATGMARVNRDDFARYFQLGVPLDESTAHNSEVLLLYQQQQQQEQSVDDANRGGNVIAENPFLSTAAVSNVPPPLVESVDQAVGHCDYLNLIFSHHKGGRNQCWAIMGQYEAFHVQKYMRVPPDGKGGKLDSQQPLKLVDRGYQASGRKSLKVPTTEQTQEYWIILQKYLATVHDIVHEKLHPLAAAAATADNTVIVMVCNAGQSELLLNFLCAASHRNIDDLRHVLIFATDQTTYDLVKSLHHLPVQVFFDETNFGSNMPERAARRYADPTFMKMMMAK